MRRPTVSVVICAYTEERIHDIAEAVDSVLTQTLVPHETIVAVDHNQNLLRSLGTSLPSSVHVVHNDGPHKGSSATDNIGIASATGDIVAFMDDDAVAEADWLEHLVEPYEQANTAAVGGRLIPVWPDSPPMWFSDELNWVVGCTYTGHPANRTEVRNLIFCNASIRRRVFDSVGLLPAGTGRIANWGTGFEAEFFLTLKYRMPEAAIVYQPSAVVHHKVSAKRATVNYLAMRCYNEGFFKAKVGKSQAGLSRTPLSTEYVYLRHLLFKSVPSRLVRFYRPAGLAQAGAQVLSIAATGAGHLVGSVRN